jgi:tetratricopeptide (TPR) repeat protein
MADERENIGPPEKPLTPGQKPVQKAVAPAPPQKEVPIGFGVVTPEMERYRAMIAKDPNSRVFAALAELYRKAGMLDEAVRLCLSGTKAHPKYMSGRVALARAYADKGMLKEAKEEVLTVVSITPDNILANKILGEIQLLEGDTPKAVESFTKVLALAPDDAEAKQRLLEAGNEPVRPVQAVQEAEEILDGDILEEVPEDASIDIIEDATPIGQGGQSPEGPEASAPSEGAPAGRPERIREAGELDIPLEDDGSLDDLLADETGKDGRESEHVEESSAGAEGEPGGGEGDLWEVEQGQEPSQPTVGYAPDEDSGLEPDRETIDGDIDIEGDQELVDEFGIMEEEEGEITIEGLESARQPTVRATGGAPKAPAAEKANEPDKRRPLDDVIVEPEGEDAAPDTQGVTITTETIADIYVKQGYFDKALTVYQELQGVSPERESLKQKIAFVKNKIREAGGDHQQRSTTPIEGEATTPEPVVSESAGDRKLKENVESLDRWLTSIKRLRRL